MLKRFFAFIAIVMILSNQFCSLARAADTSSYDETFYSLNSVVFYDPRCASGATTGNLTLAGKDNLEKILNFLMRPPLSLTLAQASGIVGNLMAESNLDPTIIQGGGHAQPGYIPQSGVGFGLAQWTFPERQIPLMDHTTKDLNVPITDLGGQLDFLSVELNGKYSNTLAELKATNTAMNAAVVFHKGYEGSADSLAQIEANRGGNAEKVYATYADAPALAGSTAPQALANPSGASSSGADAGTTANSSCVSSFSGGNLVDTVKAYAWPQYLGLTTKATDAYNTAVQRAKGEGRYVGGTFYPGIDCGGFVTTLIYDSGFDKGYNSNAHGGNTSAQEAWLRQNWKQISSTDAGDRQPGDVAINDTHTYVYVGPDAFPDHYPIASASWDERAPMRGQESAADSSFRWYRKKSVVDTP